MVEPARVLVVANRTAATPGLIEAVRERAARGPAVFTLLVPHFAHGLHKVTDPEDTDVSESEAVLELALPLLRRDHPVHAARPRVALAQARPAEQAEGARPAGDPRRGHGAHARRSVGF